MILLISLPHLDLLSERILKRIFESLQDVVTGGARLASFLNRIRILERIFESLKSLQDVVTGSADLAFFLDRILHPRSVFFLSIKDSRCLSLEETTIIDAICLILTLLWSFEEVLMIVFILVFIWKLLAQT